MRVTVCELPDDEHAFLQSWLELKNYLETSRSDLLLLPEMPFCRWIASSPTVCFRTKIDAVGKHRFWVNKLNHLNVRYIVFTMPVMSHGKFHNTAFLFEKGEGVTELHSKYYLPEEPHFWETTWFHRKKKAFKSHTVNDLTIGILLCTEMWFMENARSYGEQGVDILLCPRATGAGSTDRWLICGQALAVVSGAYCLSSNKSGQGEEKFIWGGKAFVTEPGSGKLLGVTGDEKFLTIDIDLKTAKNAKIGYPLYVTT